MLCLSRGLGQRIPAFLITLAIIGLGLSGCGLGTPEPSPPKTRTPVRTAVRTKTPMPVSESSVVPVAAASLPHGGEWRTAVDVDGVGEGEGWADPSFDDSGWATVAERTYPRLLMGAPPP